MSTLANEPSRVLYLSLLHAAAPTGDLSRLQELIEGARLGEPEVPEQAGIITFPALDGKTSPPPRLIIHQPTALHRGSLNAALKRTWDWDDAGSVVASCTHNVLVVDQNALSLPPRERWGRLQSVVAGLIRLSQEQAPCRAVHAIVLRCVVSAADFLAGASGSDGVDANPLCGAVTVRPFAVGDEDDLMVDTLGMHAFGLPDLQCLFANLDPREVIRVLLRQALEMFQEGDTLEDGSQIRGVTGKQKWTCRHEVSVAEPHRQVIDLDPGPEYAFWGRRET